MQISTKKDIQSPKLENVSSISYLQDMFCDKPASGDFFIKRKIGDRSIVPPNGSVILRINPMFFENLSPLDKKSVAILLKLKAYSSNGRIWNYNPHSISGKIGISTYMLNKYVKIMIDKKFCYFNKQGDLVLISLSKIMGSRRDYRVFVFDNDSINKIVTKINYSILKFYGSRQDFVRRLKRNEHQAKSSRFSNPNNLYRKGSQKFLKERKACAKIKENTGIIVRGEFIDYNIFGIRRISQILNCSTKKAICFLNVLKKHKVIRTKERVLMSSIYNGGFYGSEYYKDAINKEVGYCFKHGNIVYRHLGTEIIFNESSDKR